MQTMTKSEIRNLSLKMDLTPEMIMAIKRGMAELSNNGDWNEYADAEEIEMVYKGMSQLRAVLES